jgi:hypothetical protein
LSSGEDDLIAREARALNDAREAAGLLRELERICGGPAKESRSTLEPFRDGLEDTLETAARLLGTGDRMSRTISYLQLVFSTAEEISFDLVHQNIGLLALVAGALELRFNIRPGGGYGGCGFTVSEITGDRNLKAI